MTFLKKKFISRTFQLLWWWIWKLFALSLDLSHDFIFRPLLIFPCWKILMNEITKTNKQDHYFFIVDFIGQHYTSWKDYLFLTLALNIFFILIARRNTSISKGNNVRSTYSTYQSRIHSYLHTQLNDFGKYRRTSFSQGLMWVWRGHTLPARLWG